MLKYLRMDLYRLFKGKMLWVMLVVLLVMALLSASTMSWATTQESVFASAWVSYGATGGTIDDFERSQSSLWLTSGVMGFITSLAIALFFALDFSTGYVKNLPASHPERMRYYREKLVLIVLLVVGMFAFAIGAFELFRMMIGLPYEHVGTVGEVAFWFGLSVLSLSAYGAVTALVTLFSRGKGAGIAVAVLFSSGFLEWQPLSIFGLLKQGGEALLASPGDIEHVLVASAVIIAACAAVALGVCSRRDV